MTLKICLTHCKLEISHALCLSSVFNYLRKVRMEYAVNLLHDQALSVDEVADILGYAHSQHFSSAFKSVMGVNPSTFQESKKRYRAIA